MKLRIPSEIRTFATFAVLHFVLRKWTWFSMWVRTIFYRLRIKDFRRMQLFLRHLPVGHFDLKAISYISCTDSDTSCIFTVGIIWLLASFGMVSLWLMTWIFWFCVLSGRWDWSTSSCCSALAGSSLQRELQPLRCMVVLPSTSPFAPQALSLLYALQIAVLKDWIKYLRSDASCRLIVANIWLSILMQESLG